MKSQYKSTIQPKSQISNDSHAINWFNNSTSDVTGDIADQAQHLIEMFTLEALKACNENKSRQKLHFEERKKQGLGGICEDCGSTIPTKRLEAVPYATRCYECQKIFEQRHINN